MAAKTDYYATLGIERGAADDEIRKAYRRLARKYHPDLNPGDKTAEERFKKVQEAYDILSDSKKKQMYDQYGFYSDQAAAAGRRWLSGRPASILAASIFRIIFNRRAAATAAASDRQRLEAVTTARSRFWWRQLQGPLQPDVWRSRQAGPVGAGEGQRSRVRAEHHFLAIDQRHAGTV